MKSVEESGLSFGISRLLACAEQNGLAAAVANCHSSNLQFPNSTHHNLSLNSTTNHLSLFQQAHNSLNQSTENENCLIKSNSNGDKLNNENTLNLINSFTHYNNLANLTNHTNKNFLSNGFKPALDSSLKGTTLLNALANSQANNSRNSPKIILNSSGLNSSSNSLSTSINNINPVSNGNQSFLTNSANSSCTNNLTPPLVASTLNLAKATNSLNVAAAACTAIPCIPPRRIGHPYQNRTPPKRKKPRTSFNRHQIHELEKRFQNQKYLASTERAALAKQLTMSDAQVKTWFQNRRTKWRQNVEEINCERQAANRLLFSLQNNTDHSGKALNTHNAFAAAAAAAAVAQHHSSNLFNTSNQNHLTHPMNLLNNCSTSNTNANQLSLPHHLLSPKSTASNSSTSRDQLIHENDLNDLKNQPNQNMHQHLNQLIHHQQNLLSSSNSHLLSNNSNSIQSLSDPSNHFSNNLNQHSLTSSLNNSTTNPIRNDFHHQNSSMAAAVAALNSPGHLFNRSLNQISHLHQLGASIANNYSLSLANGQSPINPLNQSLISQMSSNGQLKSPNCSSPSSTTLASNTTTCTSNGNTAAQLYNMNQLSQLSHFAQLGFLTCNPNTLNALKFNNNLNNQSNSMDQLRNEKINEKNIEESLQKKEWLEEKNSKNTSLLTNNEDLTDNESSLSDEIKNEKKNFDIEEDDCEEEIEEEIDMSETIDNNEIKKKKIDSLTGKLYSIKNSDILSEENKRKKLLLKTEKTEKKPNKKKLNKKMNFKLNFQIKENEVENFYSKSDDEESIDIEESDDEIEIKKQKSLNDPKIDELINKEERKKLKIKAYKLITSNSSIIGSA